MAWRRPGDKPLSEPVMVSLQTHICVTQPQWINHYWDYYHGTYGDVIKWKRFPRYWLFVWGIHRWPVNSRHKGQWRGALMFSLICAWINGGVNNREAGDLRRHTPSCSLWRHRNDYMKYMYPLINWVEVFLQNQNEYYTKRWIYPMAFVIIDNIIMFICVPNLCWVIKRINCDSGVQPPSNCNITKVTRAKWVAQSCWCICFDLYWHTHSQLLMKCLSDATRMNTEPYDITMTWDVHWGISNHPHPTVCLTTPSG